MTCLVIGATGRTGLAFLEQALTQEVWITAFVRSPEKLSIERKNLTVVKGDAFDEAAVKNLLTISNFDAVLIAVAGGIGKDHTNEIITQNVVSGSQGLSQSPHIWILSACGTGDSYSQRGFLGKFLKATILRNPFADHEIQERIVRESGLPYTIVRPVGLTSGKLTKDGFVARETGKMPTERISRADVAYFMLTNLVNKEMDGKAFSLSNKT